MIKLKKRRSQSGVEYTLEAYKCCSSCDCSKKSAVDANADSGTKENNK